MPKDVKDSAESQKNDAPAEGNEELQSEDQGEEKSLEDYKEMAESKSGIIHNLNEENKKARQEREALKKKLDAFKDVNIEEYMEMKKQKQMQEAEKLKAGGNVEKIIASAKKDEREKYLPRIEALEQEREKLNALLRERTINTTLTNYAAANKAIKPSHVVNLISPYIKLDESFQPYVVDDTGEVVRDSGLPITLENYVKKFLKENDYLVIPTGNRGSGGQRTNSKGEISRLEIGAMSNEQYAKDRDKIFSNLQNITN